MSRLPPVACALLIAGCYAGDGPQGGATEATGGLSSSTGSSGPAPEDTTGPAGSSGTGAPEPTTGSVDETTGAPATTGGTTGGTTDAPEGTSTGEPPVFPPPELACEYGFFAFYFDKANGPELAALREESFSHLALRTAELQACAPGVTLGGLLSLLIFEGAARVAAYNTKCVENSYDDSPTCWDNPKARYSYQFGLAPVHTSNFHPCADVGWTGKMRARLQAALDAAGYVPTADEIASVTADVQQFCPGVAPTAVDYYIVAAHSAFGVPTDAAGNDLAHAGTFPFFTPSVMIDLFFATLLPACDQIASDNDAVVIFGGGDASYEDPAKQAQILGLWADYAAQSCP